MKFTEAEVSAAMETLPALWVTKYGIKNEAGVPLDFSKRKFQWDIYNDLSSKQVILKPPQIGMTVCNTLKALWVAKKLGRQIIYTLPTQGDVQDMVGGSFNRIIAQNPVLMDWVKDHDTIEQKSVGDSIIFYRGTFTSKQAMMIPSGLNIHDEVDASDPGVITQYETRLQAQEDGGWRWYFSHPTLAGHGVDIYWQQSDKKEWYITCPHCEHLQTLTWPQNISVERRCYVCAKCDGELPNESRINGEWINQDGIPWSGHIEGDYEFSGWHVSQLLLHNKSAEDVLKAKADPMKDEQYFYNYVLGLPYLSSENKISAETILKNVFSEVNSQQDRIIIGVDTGLPIHYVCLNKQGVFYYNKCKEPSQNYDPYKELESLLQRWPKSVLVADQGGDLIGIRQLQAKYPGRIFLCYYRKDRKSNEIIRWGQGDDFGIVTVDRNRMIQLIVEHLRDPGRIRLQGTREEWKEMADHFENIYREKIAVKESKDKDDRTLYGDEYVWKRKGADHFVHALLYALVGLDKYAESMAKIVGSDVLADLEVGRIFQ